MNKGRPGAILAVFIRLANILAHATRSKIRKVSEADRRFTALVSALLELVDS